MPVSIPLFCSEPHPCAYLPDRLAQDLVVDPASSADADTASLLNRSGFRRSGAYFYRPACPGCQACLALRIPVADFRWRRHWHRLQRRNADLQVRHPAGIDDAAHFALFARYIDNRHGDGGMAPATREDYRRFLCQPPGPYTFFVSVHDTRQGLLAAMVCDAFADGLSAVYSFYEPSETRRSLGSWLLLWLLEQAGARGLPYVYPGFYVHGCRKMAYKARFAPLQAWQNDRWQDWAGPGL